MKADRTLILAAAALIWTVAAPTVRARACQQGTAGGAANDARREKLERAEVLAAHAMGLYCRGRLRAAKAELEQALILSEQGEPMAWHGLALIYTAERRPREAIAAYRHIVQRIPYWSGFQQGQYARSGPAPWLAMLELAVLLNGIGERDEAVALYRDTALFGLGFGDDQEPLPVTGMFDLRNAQRAYTPGRLDAVLNVAIGLIRMSQRTIGCLYDPASIDPENTPSKEWTALNEKAALAHFRAAVKAQPDAGIAQFYLGYELSLHGGSKTEAGRALDRAAACGPDTVREAVRQFRATGKVSLPGVSAKEESFALQEWWRKQPH